MSKEPSVFGAKKLSMRLRSLVMMVWDGGVGVLQGRKVV